MITGSILKSTFLPGDDDTAGGWGYCFRHGSILSTHFAVGNPSFETCVLPHSYNAFRIVSENTFQLFSAGKRWKEA